MKAQHKVRIIPNNVCGGEAIFSNVLASKEFPAIIEGRYEVRLAKNAKETASALKLRYKIFSVELACEAPSTSGSILEFDAFDFKCRHLIVIDRYTGATVGTYRLNTLETAGSIRGFYSADEFTIENLPDEILQNGIEIGRACIAKDHRNTKVLFLLWKALLSYLTFTEKQYFFGCCSIFTQDVETGSSALNQLRGDGHMHEQFGVTPKHDGLSPDDTPGNKPVELPALFNMYLRIGAKVCGPPMIDREFGTIDFFVVFDVTKMNKKYSRMFAA
jgi:putative hemolysin